MTTMKSVHIINFIILLSCPLLLLAQQRPPNFVIIFADDQGYNDVGVYGSPLISTPELDQMAQEGMRFTHFYAGASICTPSRAALLTGTHPSRLSLPLDDVFFPEHETGMNPNELTLAELLKARGYATTCIGKWHLGHKTRYLPTNQGFDSYLGIPYSNDMHLDRTMPLSDTIKLNDGWTVDRMINEPAVGNLVPLMRDTVVIEYPVDQSTLTRRYTDEAMGFIAANLSQPFFLYLAHTMPHIPLYASSDFEGSNPSCAAVGAERA
jgi:hypothetical protein